MIEWGIMVMRITYGGKGEGDSDTSGCQICYLPGQQTVMLPTSAAASRVSHVIAIHSNDSRPVTSSCPKRLHSASERIALERLPQSKVTSSLTQAKGLILRFCQQSQEFRGALKSKGGLVGSVKGTGVSWSPKAKKMV